LNDDAGCIDVGNFYVFNGFVEISSKRRHNRRDKFIPGFGFGDEVFQSNALVRA